MHNVSAYLENLSIPLGTGHLVGRDLKGRRSVRVVVMNVGRHVQHDWPHSSKQLVVHLPVHTDISPSLGQFVQYWPTLNVTSVLGDSVKLECPL